MIDLVIKRPGDKLLDNQIIEKIRKKQNYNKLLFKITQYNLQNSKAPEKLLKEAKELGRQLEIPKQNCKILNLKPFKSYQQDTGFTKPERNRITDD